MLQKYELEALEWYFLLITRYCEYCPHCGARREIRRKRSHVWQWMTGIVALRPTSNVVIEIQRRCKCESMIYRFRAEEQKSPSCLTDDEVPF